MNNLNILLVGGMWDDTGGRPSRIFSEMSQKIIDYFHFVVSVDSLKNINNIIGYYNGGFFNKLNEIIRDITKYHIILWMVKVDNDQEKVVKLIKEKNSKCILITSKVNEDRKYLLADIIHRILDIKSNLCIEIKKEPTSYFSDRLSVNLIDPLGNRFYTGENFKTCGVLAIERAIELSKFKRVFSKSVGDCGKELGTLRWDIKVGKIPEIQGFLKIIRESAEEFTLLINPSKNLVNRFVGNASFRCQSGFWSMRSDDNLMFISRRNIDKEKIDADGFVPVFLDNDVYLFGLRHYGQDKPSVDSPIHVMLYNHYQKINFIMHSHCYIKGAPFTERILPCGCVENFLDVTHIVKDREVSNIVLNLRGHGSLLCVNALDKFENIVYEARPEYEVASN